MPSLLPHLTRNLRLTPVRAAALSLAVAEGSEQTEQLRPLARQHFLRTVGEIADALAQGGEQRQEAVNVSSSEKCLFLNVHRAAVTWIPRLGWSFD